jgi:hypothetical protein
MIVDSSYLAWVQPTRRVHLALSVGMTVTGVVLTVVGFFGSSRPAPALGRAAETGVTRTATPSAGPVLPVPLARPGGAMASATPHPVAPLPVGPPVTPHPAAKSHPVTPHHVVPRPVAPQAMPEPRPRQMVPASAAVHPLKR